MKNTFYLLLGLLLSSSVVFAQQPALESLQEIKEKRKQRTFSTDFFSPTKQAKLRGPLDDEYGNPPQWERIGQVGGDGRDLAYSVTSDAAGNVYMTGSFSGEIQFDNATYTSVGYEDLFVAKIAIDGTVVWFQQYEAPNKGVIKGLDIELGEMNSIYLAGYFAGNITSLGTAISTSRRTSFFAKLDANGTAQWARSYDDADGQELAGQKIQLDADSNLYVLQVTSPGFNNPEGYLTKFDPNGNLLWANFDYKRIGDFEVAGNELFMTGVMRESTSFGSTTLMITGFYGNGYVAKSNLDLAFEWALQIKSNDRGDSQGNSIKVDANGDCFVSGFYRDSCIINGVVGTVSVFSNLGLYFAKCSNDGQFEWSNFAGINSLIFSRMALDNVGNLLAAGPLNTTIDFADGTMVTGLDESYLLKLDKNTGAYSFRESISGDINSLDVTSNGSILNVGDLYGNFQLWQYKEDLVEDWKLESAGKSGAAFQDFQMKVHLDNAGNMYHGGDFIYHFSQSDSTPYAKRNAAFFRKTDQAGNELWVRTLEAEDGRIDCYANTTDELGNSLLAGRFTGTMKTSIGDFTGENQSFIAKYDANGTLQMMIQYSEADIYSVAFDSQGNILVSGYFGEDLQIGSQTLSRPNGEGAYVAKFSGQGDFLWAREAGGEGSEYNNLLAVGPNDAIYLAVESTSPEFIVGPIRKELEPEDGNIILLKFDADGTVQWLKTYGGGGAREITYCWPDAIAIDAKGDIYLSGMFGPDNDFGNTRFKNPFYTEGRYHRLNWFNAKLDKDGEVIWAKTINVKNFAYTAYQVDYDREGNLYMGGFYRDSILFLDNTLVLTPDDPDGRNSFVAKYDVAGDLEWLKTIGGEGVVDIAGLSVAEEDELIICGDFYGQAIFEDNLELCNTSNNIFLSSTDNLTTDVQYLHPDYFSFNVSPNPFHSKLQAAFTLAETDRVQLSLFDLQGRELKTIDQGKLAAGQHTVELAAGDLANGMYFLRLQIGDVVSVKKVERIR